MEASLSFEKVFVVQSPYNYWWNFVITVSPLSVELLFFATCTKLFCLLKDAKPEGRMRREQEAVDDDVIKNYVIVSLLP